MTDQPLRRVVIVDDTAVTASGTEVLLRADPRIEVVETMDHGAALEWPGRWQDVDVLLLDAADPTRPDQFPGVGVLRHVRAIAPGPPTVIVLTDRFAHPGLAERVRQGGADFLFLREDVRSALDLAELVLHPERWLRTPIPPRRRPPRNLGLTEDSDLNAIVDYMRTHELDRRWRDEARVRSRQNEQHRRELVRIGRVRPVTVEGNLQRIARSPGIPQWLRIWDWATVPGPPD